MLSPPEVDPDVCPGPDGDAAPTGSDASPPDRDISPDVDVVWQTVRSVVPDGLDRDGCRALLSDLARLRAWVDATEVRAARRIRALAAEGKAEPVESAITGSSGCSGRDARTAAGSGAGL